MLHRISEWLETRFCVPAYSGWLLGVVALCFFGAATNTMAGWLYAISGTILALLVLGAILPRRSLAHLQIRRRAIAPVSAGDSLTVELEIANPTAKPKTLLQVADLLPVVLASPVKEAVSNIAPQSVYRWRFYPTAQKRGIYQWHEVRVRTGTPLGLCWSRRSWTVPAQAIVYPQVLPLSVCPLIDRLGQDYSAQSRSDRILAATQGLTKTLRPYRHGDSTRLIAWRTSARFDQLQVRELEEESGKPEIIIALDSAFGWREDDFEQAVIAAASLYFYANRCQLNVKLWTAQSGLVDGRKAVLETLAAVMSKEDATAVPSSPLIWITQNPFLQSLPSGSHWVLFADQFFSEPLSLTNTGLVIDAEKPLQQQLQQSI